MRRSAFLFLFLAVAAGLAWGSRIVHFEGVEEPGRIADGTWTSGYEAEIDASETASTLDYARIHRRLQMLMERPSMVGLAVGIVENGEIRFLQGYGETVAGSGDPVTVDTVFRWASLSKGVAGDLVALLAEEEALSLNDPLSRWTSTLRLPGGAEARATVSDLLTHRLGLPGHAQDSKLEDDHDPRVLRMQLSTLDSNCPPGQCHAYQNVAFDAVTEIVERVTARPYRDVVRERLFLPLGMTSATMTDRKSVV